MRDGRAALEAQSQPDQSLPPRKSPGVQETVRSLTSLISALMLPDRYAPGVPGTSRSTGPMRKEPQAWGGPREEIPDKEILFYWVLKDEWG